MSHLLTSSSKISHCPLLKPPLPSLPPPPCPLLSSPTSHFPSPQKPSSSPTSSPPHLAPLPSLTTHINTPLSTNVVRKSGAHKMNTFIRTSCSLFPSTMPSTTTLLSSSHPS